MTDLESTLATAEVYANVNAMLGIERLILARMMGAPTTHAPTTIAQSDRVAHLEAILAMFGEKITQNQQGAPHE